MKYLSKNPEETKSIAKALAEKFKDGGIIALSGPLGAGKTTFVQGFAKGLGIPNPILSPTFILIRQYPIPNYPKGQLYHIDLYRLDNLEEIDSLGLKEILTNPNNIVLIEWAEKLGSNLPQDITKINLLPLKENSRKITIKPKAEK